MKITTNVDGTIVDCHPGFLHIDPEGLIGKPIQGFLGVEFRELLERLYVQPKLAQETTAYFPKQALRVLLDWELRSDGLIGATCQKVFLAKDAVHDEILRRLKNDPCLKDVLQSYVLGLGRTSTDDDDLGQHFLELLQNHSDNDAQALVQRMPYLAKQASAFLHLAEIRISANSPNVHPLVYPTIDYIQLIDRGLEEMNVVTKTDGNQTAIYTLPEFETELSIYEPVLEMIPGIIYLHDDSDDFRYLQFRGDRRRLNKQPEILLGQAVDFELLDRVIAEPRRKALEEARRLGRRVTYTYEHYWRDRPWYFQGAAAPFPSTQGNKYISQIGDRDPDQLKWWANFQG